MDSILIVLTAPETDEKGNATDADYFQDWRKLCNSIRGILGSNPKATTLGLNVFLIPAKTHLPVVAEILELAKTYRIPYRVMFLDDQPAPLEEARAYAAQLVGGDKLQAALGDSWLQEQILTDCRLHYTNWITGDSPALPQLIIGDVISSGPLNSVEHLMILLNHYLGLTPPAGYGL